LVLFTDASSSRFDGPPAGALEAGLDEQAARGAMHSASANVLRIPVSPASTREIMRMERILL
jgi:hypothetical protein